MAFTYRWQDLTSQIDRLIKGVPMNNWALYCDMISSDMFTSYPWRDSLDNIAEGQIPLVDGQQDYDVPRNIYRLTKASIVRTDQTPISSWELNVQTDLDEDTSVRGYPSIRMCSLQSGAGLLRLESAVQIPSGETLELRGEFQINSPKIHALTDWLWFQDHYAQVAFAGLLYWGYKMSDDSRAGTAATNGKGDTNYSGQLAEYKAALRRMRTDEEYGPTESYYPSESMGADRDQGYGLPLFGR